MSHLHLHEAATVEVAAIGVGETTAILALTGDLVDELGEVTLTEPLSAATIEASLFDEPMPLPVAGEPVYLVEAQPPGRRSKLIGVRGTLAEAVQLAESVHPAVADVSIAEVPLPCDAEVLAAVLSHVRRWSRGAGQPWCPSLPTNA